MCNIVTEFYLYSIVYIYLINSRLDVTNSVRHHFRTTYKLYHILRKVLILHCFEIRDLILSPGYGVRPGAGYHATRGPLHRKWNISWTMTMTSQLTLGTRTPSTVNKHWIYIIEMLFACTHALLSS